MNKNIKEGFKNPEVIYRSAPFWSWNDNLEVEELCHQLDRMKEGGFGGGFMHSRVGLITPYLSEEWLKCIEETTKYAKKSGLKTYLYDEDRWPSGFAGGIATKRKRNRTKSLKIFKKRNKWSYEIDQTGSSEWFNGSTYIDTMREETVGEFIQSTYEVYRNTVGSFFNSTIPAIFTDEPNYFSRCGSRWEKNTYYFPWTDNFEKLFKKKYGYNILEKIKALIEEIPGFETIRYHYYRLITELFAQNFGRKIYDWCKKNQIQLTGHYLAEDTLEGQISVIGDAMVLYESMQWPGVDHLGRNLDHPLTLKQCSSVAHQLGKERVLSELYGCSGQSFTLAERKWIGDWHIVLGINFFCPHLYLYSLRGTRKRDYPPTISHHQPYWKYNKPLEDYFARLNFILSKGTFKANILVVHPIESSWCVRGTDEIKELDDSLAKITQSLLENKFEYDFGNESLMEKYASVEDGKLIMGKMSYEFVIITPSVTIRRRTISLLKEFYASGGKIFASEKFPSLVEGKSERGVLPELRKRCVMYKSTEHLITLLKKSVPCEIEIRDEKGENIPEIFIHRRELDPSTSVVFFANTSIKRYVSAQLKIKSVGKVWEADPFTGKLETVSVNKMGGAMIINCDFHGVSSHLLVIENRRKPVTGKEEKVNLKNSKKLTNWNLWLDKPNVLILDFCRYKSGKMKSWSKFLPVIKVQDILEKENRRGKISLLFEFKVEKDFVPENLNLVIEQAERYHILLNGKKISSVSSNWWLDKSFKIVTLPSDAIKKGKNQLVLTALFIPPKKRGTLIFTKDGIELETIYLLGNFSLKTRKTEARNGGCYYFHTGFSLSNPQQLTDKDLNVQGYPFYTGSLLAETEIEIKDKDHSRRYFIRFDEFRAVAAGVTINSKYSGVVYLPPYHIEVTKLLKKGRNTILLEIVSSLRNLLGPHHQKDPNPEFVDPNSFLDMENWSQAYSTHAFGLGRISLLTYSK